MTEAEKYVAVFRAAAQGVMEPWVEHSGTFDPASQDHARSIAGAFNAIADVFQGIVDAEAESPE